MIVKIGSVGQLVNLAFQSLIPLFISVSERIYRISGREIQISFTLRIVQIRTFSILQDHWSRIVCVYKRILYGVHI